MSHLIFSELSIKVFKTVAPFQSSIIPKLTSLIQPMVSMSSITNALEAMRETGATRSDIAPSMESGRGLTWNAQVSKERRLINICTD